MKTAAQNSLFDQQSGPVMDSLEYDTADQEVDSIEMVLVVTGHLSDCQLQKCHQNLECCHAVPVSPAQ